MTLAPMNQATMVILWIALKQWKHACNDSSKIPKSRKNTDMAWILAAVYCGLLWLVFARLKLIRMTLPIAVVAGSVGPSLIITLLFCAQYFHPFSTKGVVLSNVVPIAPQLREPGRVLTVNVKGNEPIKKGDVLFRVDPIPYEIAVKSLESELAVAKQNEQFALASVDNAKAVVDRAKANLEFATHDRDRNAALVETNSVSQDDYERALTRYVEAESALTQANAASIQAVLSVESSKQRTVQVEQKLKDAAYDLEQTTVLAPGDGFVVNLQLRPGMLVGGNAGSIVSFVLNSSEDAQGVIVATFDQKHFLLIKSGQYAEVSLRDYPGEIFTGRVLNTIDMNGKGQLMASGDIPEDIGAGAPSSFAARIKLDKGDGLRLPGGSQACVAVYTDNVQVAGIPVMFIIRTYSWLNYLF